MLQRTAVCVLVLGVMLGCSSEPFTGDRVENQPPTVWLASAPPEGDESVYRIQLFWGGWDPDGEIAYYEYKITDNETGLFEPEDTMGEWTRVIANDSIFVFSADKVSNPNTTQLVSRFERSHTFFIRAVDEEGARSREPAYRSFTAWTLSPTVFVEIPRKNALTPASVPPITTYQWIATDYANSLLEIQDPDSVRYILKAVEGSDFPGAINYVRQHPDDPLWSDWQYYRAPDDSGKSWTTPPVEFGSYIFAIQAKDEAGAVTPVFDEEFNVRRVRVSTRSTGPLLDVGNEFIGSIRTNSPNTPAVIIDLPAGVPIEFTWQASAKDYGGKVSGYRYGWDIADLTDPDQWETDYTPFVTETARAPIRQFFFGTHTFNIEVVDNSGFVSRVEVKINIIQFTMERDLLVVDDYYENPRSSGWALTNGAVPNDLEHDSFWLDMVSDYAGFNPDIDVFQPTPALPMTIVRLAKYKSVIWNAFGGYGLSDDVRPALYNFIKFRSKTPENNQQGGKVSPNLVALFVRAGGHLLLCGEQPLTQTINADFFDAAPRFPMLLKYELEGKQDGRYQDQVQDDFFIGDRSFAFQEGCVNVLDVAYSSYASIRNNFNNGCGVELIRDPNPVTNGLREAEALEAGFPDLTLRIEAAGTGRHYAPDRRGLNAEIYNPPYFNFCIWSETTNPRTCIEPIYAMKTLNGNVPQEGAPVAFWTSAYSDVKADAPGAIKARSVVLGFAPVFFEPDQVKQLIDRVLVDEWQLQKQ